MLAIWVKVRVKPDQKKRFLEAIEIDALGSERDEPGCLRFNVLQDEQDIGTSGGFRGRYLHSTERGGGAQREGTAYEFSTIHREGAPSL